MNKRKTKIVATIGPVTSSKENLKKLIKSGVNVCRLNFSHSTHEEHVDVIKNIRDIDSELGTHTAILGDLQGPKIRKIEVKDNNIEQALRVLKRKLQRDGFFKVIKLKNTYEKPSEKKKRILQENIKRVKKLNKLKNRI
jgi:small subunit ribosomal protein S21